MVLDAHVPLHRHSQLFLQALFAFEAAGNVNSTVTRMKQRVHNGELGDLSRLDQAHRLAAAMVLETYMHTIGEASPLRAEILELIRYL